MSFSMGVWKRGVPAYTRRRSCLPKEFHSGAEEDRFPAQDGFWILLRTGGDVKGTGAASLRR